MKKKSSLVSYFILIFIIGVVSTILNSDIPLAGMIQNLKNYDIEVLLEYLNLGLGFLVFVLLAVFVFYRVFRQDKDQDLQNPWDDEAE